MVTIRDVHIKIQELDKGDAGGVKLADVANGLNVDYELIEPHIEGLRYLQFLVFTNRTEDKVRLTATGMLARPN